MMDNSPNEAELEFDPLKANLLRHVAEFKEPEDVRIAINELNFFLTCRLCSGYLHNATTITECLHSFCKSCLVHHVSQNLHCPQCDILIHPSNPFVNMRLDSTVQDTVYKLVPNLLKDDRKKQMEFYISKGLPYPPKETVSESNPGGNQPRLTRDGPFPSRVSVFLKYAGKSSSLSNHKNLAKSYLRLPCYTTVGHIEKFLWKKLEPDNFSQICIFHATYLLHPSLTLQEIWYLFLEDIKSDLLVLHYGVIPQYDYFKPLKEPTVNHDYESIAMDDIYDAGDKVVSTSADVQESDSECRFEVVLTGTSDIEPKLSSSSMPVIINTYSLAGGDSGAKDSGQAKNYDEDKESHWRKSHTYSDESIDVLSIHSSSNEKFEEESIPRESYSHENPFLLTHINPDQESLKKKAGAIYKASDMTVTGLPSNFMESSSETSIHASSQPTTCDSTSASASLEVKDAPHTSNSETAGKSPQTGDSSRNCSDAESDPHDISGT